MRLQRLRTRLIRRGREAPATSQAVEPAAYAGRHAGSDVVVLGNGPSLFRLAEPLNDWLDAERPLVLGANAVTPFRHPDYHAFTNRKRFAEFARTVDPQRSRVLLGPYLPPDLVAAHYRGEYERLAYVADNDAPFDIDENGVVLASCRTVSVLLIGVAIVMGAGSIRVAGLDGFGTLDGGALEDGLDEREREHRRSIDRYTERFLREIQAWLERHGRPPFTIVTPTTFTAHRDDPLGLGP